MADKSLSKKGCESMFNMVGLGRRRSNIGIWSTIAAVGVVGVGITSYAIRRNQGSRPGSNQGAQS